MLPVVSCVAASWVEAKNLRLKTFGHIGAEDIKLFGNGSCNEKDDALKEKWCFMMTKLLPKASPCWGRVAVWQSQLMSKAVMAESEAFALWVLKVCMEEWKTLFQ